MVGQQSFEPQPANWEIVDSNSRPRLEPEGHSNSRILCGRRRNGALVDPEFK